MGFEPQGCSHLQWMPVDHAGGSFDTLYVGQLVESGSDGVLPVGVAGAGPDTSSHIFGIVVGTNLYSPTFNTTYKGESITSSNPHSSTTDYRLGEGPLAVRGDKTAMVQVAIIDPCTIIKGRIFNAAYGTAPTVVTVTTGSTTGAGYTAGACDFTPVADLATTYCRTGANAGIYRITTDTSTTIRTVDHYFPYDIAIGDTFVSVPIRHSGKSQIQFDAESTYIEASAAAGGNHFVVTVLKLDLSTAGQEYCLFRFSPIHFD